MSLDAIMRSVDPSPPKTNCQKVVTMINRKSPDMVVLQGQPGAGKSFLAEELKRSCDAVIASADHHFLKEDGSYAFQPDQLRRAHEKCQSVARQAIKEGKLVIVDNTNIQLKDVQSYLEMVDSSQIVVVQIKARDHAEALKCAKRGIHAPAEYSMLSCMKMERIPHLHYLILDPQF